MADFRALEGEIVIHDKGADAINNLIARGKEFDTVLAGIDQKAQHLATTLATAGQAFGNSGAGSAFTQMFVDAQNLERIVDRVSDKLKNMRVGVVTADLDRLISKLNTVADLQRTIELRAATTGAALGGTTGVGGQNFASTPMSSNQTAALAAMYASQAVSSYPNYLPTSGVPLSGGGGATQTPQQAAAQIASNPQVVGAAAQAAAQAAGGAGGQNQANTPQAIAQAATQTAISVASNPQVAAAAAAAAAQAATKQPQAVQAQQTAVQQQATIQQAAQQQAQTAQQQAQTTSLLSAASRRSLGNIGQQAGQQLAYMIPGLGGLQPLAGQLLGGAGRALFSGSLGVGGTVLGGIGAGFGVGAIAFVKAMEEVDKVFERLERRSNVIELLNRRFEDAAQVAERTRAAIGNVATEMEVFATMRGVQEGSPLADTQNFQAVAQIARNNAFELGQTTPQTMQQLVQIIQTGNGALAEQLGLIENWNRDLLEFAEILGIAVPEMTAFQQQQAVIYSLMKNNQGTFEETAGDAEKYREAQANNVRARNEFTNAAIENLASIWEPSAESQFALMQNALDAITESLDRQTAAWKTNAAARRFAVTEATPEELALNESLSRNPFVQPQLPANPLMKFTEASRDSFTNAVGGVDLASLFQTASANLTSGRLDNVQVAELNRIMGDLDVNIRAMTDSADNVGKMRAEQFAIAGALGVDQAAALMGRNIDTAGALAQTYGYTARFTTEQERAGGVTPDVATILQRMTDYIANEPQREAALVNGVQTALRELQIANVTALPQDQQQAAAVEVINDMRQQQAAIRSQLDASRSYADALTAGDTAAASAILRDPRNQGLDPALFAGGEETAAATRALTEQNRELSTAIGLLTGAVEKSAGLTSGSIADAAGLPRPLVTEPPKPEARTPIESQFDWGADLSQRTADMSLYQQMVVEVTLAKQALNEAMESGSQAEIEEARALLAAAEANQAFAATMQELETTTEGVHLVAGMVVNDLTGMVTAFDTGAVSGEMLGRQIDQLTLKLQSMGMAAEQSAFASASALTPLLGFSGQFAVGMERAGEISDLRQGIAELQGRTPGGIPEGAVQSLYQSAGAIFNARNQVAMADSRGGGGRDYGKALDSALDSMISGMMRPTTEGLIPLDKMLPRRDEVDEPARRLADVAKLGTKSPWFNQFKDIIPEEVLQQGEARIKAWSAEMVRNHQEGLTTMLYDQEMIVDRVIQNIKSKEELTDFIASIREKVKAEVGEDASDIDIMKAMGIDTSQAEAAAVSQQVRDLAGTSIEQLLTEFETAITGLEKSPAERLFEMDDNAKATVTAQGGVAGAAYGEGAVTQTKTENGNYGGRMALNITEQLKLQKTLFENTGITLATWMGEALTTKFSENVPAKLLEILTDELVPLMEEAMNDSGERNSGSSGVTGAANSGFQ